MIGNVCPARIRVNPPDGWRASPVTMEPHEALTRDVPKFEVHVGDEIVEIYDDLVCVNCGCIFTEEVRRGPRSK